MKVAPTHPEESREELLSRGFNTSLRRVLGPKLRLDLRSEVRMPLHSEATLPAVHIPPLSCLSAGHQGEGNLAVFWSLQMAGLPPRISGQNLPALGKEAWEIVPWTSRRWAGNTLAVLIIWALLLRNSMREQRGVWIEKRRDHGELCFQGGCPRRMSAYRSHIVNLCGCAPWGVRSFIVQRSDCYCPALAEPVSPYMCFTTASQLGRVGELGPSRQPGIGSLRFVFSSSTRAGVALAGNFPHATYMAACFCLSLFTHTLSPTSWCSLSFVFSKYLQGKKSQQGECYVLYSQAAIRLRFGPPVSLASHWLF